MRIFAKKIIAGCEGRGDAGDVYLTRWILFECWAFAIYLHRFHRSDADELHDHPWAYASLILREGYWEETEVGPGIRVRSWYGPGRLLFRPAVHAHRVVLAGSHAWTLVVRSGYQRMWGFFTSEGWLEWREYFKRKGC